jgi:2-polyprenyl-3-methyl-5-hydroxy-6-metoxy-1,4-benzoquinol methylase
MKLETCPLCGEGAFTSFLQIDHRYIVKCVKCTHIFASEYSEEELKRIYLKDYYSSSDDPRITDWIQKNKSVWNGLVKTLHHYINPNSLCDIGAGTGGFLITHKELYPNTELYAVESSEEAVGFLKAKISNLNIITSSADTIKKVSLTVDAVTMFQTLEHLKDPRSVTSDIYEKINKGGLLFLTVPNVNSYMVKLKKDKYCFQNSTHLHFFSYHNLKKLLLGIGFQNVIRVTQWGGSDVSGLKKIPQFCFRYLGISTELRIIAFK